MNLAVSSPDPMPVVEPAPVASRVPVGDMGALPSGDDLFAFTFVVGRQLRPAQAVTLWLPAIERGMHGMAAVADRGNAWPGEARSLLRIVQLVSGLNGHELARILGRSLTEVALWLDREPMPQEVHAAVEHLWLAVRANDQGTAFGNRLAMTRLTADGRDGVALASAADWGALEEHLHTPIARPTPLPLPIVAGESAGQAMQYRAGEAIAGLVSGKAEDPPGLSVVKPIRR